MSKSVLMAAAVSVAFVVIAAPAGAKYQARVRKYDNDFHYHAAKVRYGGSPHLGYWRKGPARGHGVAFAFSTYRGDPFGSDDYYDGNRCYYVHHQNYCMRNHIFNGFD